MNVDILWFCQRRPDRSNVLLPIMLVGLHQFRRPTRNPLLQVRPRVESVLDDLCLVRAVQPDPVGEVLPESLEHLAGVLTVAGLRQGFDLVI